MLRGGRPITGLAALTCVTTALCVVCAADHAWADRPARVTDWHAAAQALLPAALVEHAANAPGGDYAQDRGAPDVWEDDRRRDRFALDFEIADRVASAFAGNNHGVFAAGCELTVPGQETLRRLAELESHALLADEFAADEVLETSQALSSACDALVRAVREAGIDTSALAAAAAEEAAASWGLSAALPNRHMLANTRAAEAVASMASTAALGDTAQSLHSSGQQLDQQLALSAARIAWALRFRNPWYRGARYERSPLVEPEEDTRSPHEDWAALGLRTFLEELRDNADAGSAFAAVEPPFAEYRALRAALARYLEIEAGGGFPSMDGMRVHRSREDQRVPAIRRRLALEGLVTESPTPTVYDESLVEAVSEYQRLHQLEVDGDLGPATLRALAVPVERRIAEIWLAMGKWQMSRRAADPNGEFIWSNLPSYTAELWDNGARVHRWKVVVGRRNYSPGANANATPEMSAVLEYMVINPSWYVPDRIWRTTLHDRFQRRPELMREAGYEIVSGSGLDARVRQIPGPRNGLGRVKFMFPNRHAVFMHDTLGQHRFAQPRRAYSHGCLRAEDAIGLAKLFYQRDSGVSADEAARYIDDIVESEEERRVRLTRGVPVHLEYITVSVDENGQTQFFSDMYLSNERQLLWIERRRAALTE